MSLQDLPGAERIMEAILVERYYGPQPRLCRDEAMEGERIGISPPEAVDSY
jgi:hypothetical protein